MQTENQVCFASIVNIGICAILGAGGGGGMGWLKLSISPTVNSVFPTRLVYYLKNVPFEYTSQSCICSLKPQAG